MTERKSSDQPVAPSPSAINNDLQMYFISVQIVDKRSLGPRYFMVCMTKKVSLLYN